MSQESPSRVEIYDAIDRLERSLKDYLEPRFEALNNRMDIANGRTSKNEEKLEQHSVQLGVLLDRSNAAKTEAQTARKEVSPLKGQIKWVPFASSGFLIAIIELIRALL